MNNRKVICADSLVWMADNKQLGSIITSPPNAEECGFKMDFWFTWFIQVINLSFGVARDDCPVVFYVTDRKYGGKIISKSSICFRAAEEQGYKALWHKIVLRRKAGKIDLYRPSYTHMIAFSKTGKQGKIFPDVISAGQYVYPNAMGINAAFYAVKFIGEFCDLVIDPFCGRGTVLAVADCLGLDSIGIDIDPDQCKLSEKLQIDLAGRIEPLPMNESSPHG